MAEPSGEVTRLLQNWSHGDESAREVLLSVVYEELHRLAAAYLRRERADHTLQPTALVHEVYLKLVEEKSVDWQGRSHFFGVAAKLMRRILVDHARTRLAGKRGGGGVRVALTDTLAMSQERPDELLALDQGLARLTAIDPQQGQVVELRAFAGLSVEETAAALAISPATVKRDWAVAKAWLLREMGRTAP
jgi:RNA polymerase sigma factor (TIGR02999 family)